MMTGKRITNGLTVAAVAMGIVAATTTSVQAQASIMSITSSSADPHPRVGSLDSSAEALVCGSFACLRRS
jgi:hypothetical protein